MSHTHWSIVFLGGVRSADGQFDFQRPVLLEPAVRHMLRAVPPDWRGLYVHAQDEQKPALDSLVCLETSSLTQRLAAAKLCPEDPVMLFTAPAPAWETNDFFRLAHKLSDTESGAVLVKDADGMPFGIALAAGRLREFPRQEDALPPEMAECPDSVTWRGSAVTSAKLAYQAQKIVQQRVADRLMEQGVFLLDASGTWIAADAQIGAGTCILPGSLIYPGCIIGRDCTIGPNAVLKQAVIGERTEINASQVLESTIGSDSSVGPFAYIRPGCSVGNRTKIGDFVELKNSVIGDDTKASHLTYVGDADVGQRVNFGCGTVVVNYDGYAKHRTHIGDDCFVGCNTNLVAPVQLGDRVLTAAGSTVTDDVPDGAMAIARARQQNKTNWNDERISAHRFEKKEK